MSDFYSSTFPIGRKDYRCEWCGETIPKGEKHMHFVGVWEGEWQNYRMHDECTEQYHIDCSEDGFYPFENKRPAKAAQ